MTKDFETWCKKEKLPLDTYKEKSTGNIRYYSPHTDGAWRGWQAAKNKYSKEDVNGTD